MNTWHLNFSATNYARGLGLVICLELRGLVLNMNSKIIIVNMIKLGWVCDIFINLKVNKIRNYCGFLKKFNYCSYDQIVIFQLIFEPKRVNEYCRTQYAGINGMVSMDWKWFQIYNAGMSCLAQNDGNFLFLFLFFCNKIWEKSNQELWYEAARIRICFHRRSKSSVAKICCKIEQLNWAKSKKAA